MRLNISLAVEHNFVRLNQHRNARAQTDQIRHDPASQSNNHTFVRAFCYPVVAPAR